MKDQMLIKLEARYKAPNGTPAKEAEIPKNKEKTGMELLEEEILQLQKEMEKEANKETNTEDKPKSDDDEEETEKVEDLMAML